MKVICIDASPGFFDGQIPPFKEGDLLDASQAPYDKRDYVIAPEKYIGWDKKRFISISEIDETNFQREYNKLNQEA